MDHTPEEFFKRIDGKNKKKYNEFSCLKQLPKWMYVADFTVISPFCYCLHILHSLILSLTFYIKKRKVMAILLWVYLHTTNFIKYSSHYIKKFLQDLEGNQINNFLDINKINNVMKTDDLFKAIRPLHLCEVRPSLLIGEQFEGETTMVAFVFFCNVLTFMF